MSDTMRELRPEVAAFAQAMEAQLRANAQAPISQSLAATWFHPDYLREAADVANFAMMVADVCGGLKT